MHKLKELEFDFNSIWKEYNFTDNFLLIMSQTDFRSIQNQNEIVLIEDVLIEMKSPK